MEEMKSRNVAVMNGKMKMNVESIYTIYIDTVGVRGCGGGGDEDRWRCGQKDAWLHSIRSCHAKIHMWQLDIATQSHA